MQRNTIRHWESVYAKGEKLKMETETTEGDILAALQLMVLSSSIKSKRLNIELATQFYGFSQTEQRKSGVVKQHVSLTV